MLLVAECHYGEYYYYAEYYYAEYYYAEFYYTEYYYAEYFYAECRLLLVVGYYAECRYAESHYTECRGTIFQLAKFVVKTVSDTPPYLPWLPCTVGHN